MAVLATPKLNSYVVKKDSAEKIKKACINSKDAALLKARAETFKANNLKKK